VSRNTDCAIPAHPLIVIGVRNYPIL
jgi:hypothetical protein